jgi:hypothetical protein
MKIFNKIKIPAIGMAVAFLLIASGCEDILEETNRERFEPSFFATEAGVIGGVTGLHTTLRRIYGQPYYFGATEVGTDEFTYGGHADDNFLAPDLSGRAPFNAQNSRYDVIWGNCFSSINNASAIIKNGTEAEMPAALIAEARFFRAFHYFLLVQAFGGVPLDLGSGNLETNTNPSLTSSRNTVPEVYTIAIFPDLEQAINDLPDDPRVIGGVTKNVARLTLAKAYLTYGWWLENPNNIPTYPDAPRTDPDGNSPNQYFQLAYDVAIEGIDNPGPYALQDTYYDVHVATNDRNSEIMLWADHTENSAQYSESNITGWNGSPASDGGGENQAVWMVTWYFHELQGSSSPTEWAGTSAMTRTVAAGQSYSRMWDRMAKPIGVFTNTFADKTNDSRFDGTFTSVYRATYGYGQDINNPTAADPIYGANLLEVNPLDPIMTFLPDDPGGISYDNTYNDNTEAGYLAGRPDFVMPLTKVSRNIHPGLWKIGPYRSNNEYTGDAVSSTRPFNILKFSEFYFVAAEAAVKGASGGRTARQLINVIRARAGRWKFDVAANQERIEDNSAAMIAATPATIDINYILDERSREYYGEGYRWFDLARTQKWEEYAGSYQISETGGEDPVTVQRTIEDFHYLRPIPQTSQLDLMDGDKEIYQNPGYSTSGG